MFSCLTIVIILFSCVACKAAKPYLVKDYLNELALRSGISSGDDIDETVKDLLNWEIIDKDDEVNLNVNLKYSLFIKTIDRLISDGESIKDKKWISKNIKDDDLVDKDIALKIIDKAVDLINNKEFASYYSYKPVNKYLELDDYSYSQGKLNADIEFDNGEMLYLKNDDVFVEVINKESDFYQVKDLSFEDVYQEIQMQDTYEIDFSNVEDYPGGELIDDSMYKNSTRELLASSNNKVFSTNGFKVSYSFKRNGLDARITKKIKGINTFFDISLTSIKPSYKWKYENGQVKEAYLKVDYNAVSELGCSVGKYNNLYLDFKDKDSSSFLNELKSIVKTKDDEIEATIKICEIKTPIPQIPTAYFNIDVYARLYTTGKVEIVFNTNNTVGFESKNGSIRFINDHKKDSDFVIGGSSKGTVGVNFNIESVKKRLMDIEIDGGIRAAVSTTLHLYDEDGNKKEVNVDVPYSAADEITKENENVKACGDVSLNWVLDLKFNTSKTLLYKFGLTKTKSILDDSNQLFKNKTHIENGVFVNKCTRKNKFTSTNTSQTDTINVNKIVLDKYAVVINVGEAYTIPIRTLPSGYQKSDLKYSSMDEKVAEVNSEGKVIGKEMGACEVKISTFDNKYTASINVLVSSG